MICETMHGRPRGGGEGWGGGVRWANRHSLVLYRSEENVFLQPLFEHLLIKTKLSVR